jgi:hypothetical protein
LDERLPLGPAAGGSGDAEGALHAKADALHELAGAEEAPGLEVVAEFAASMAAVLDRCDTADPAYGPLAEACRAVIAGGMPSIAVPAAT